jgi:hypothetical protein
MSILTVDQARALVSTALDDAQLQAVIDREEAEIVRRLGAAYATGVSLAETHPGGGKSIFLRRGIGSVTTVTERVSPASDPVTLVATDYFAWADEGRLERLPPGGRWGAVIVVTYAPQDDREQWRQVEAELVRLLLARTALKSESVAGEYSYTAPDNWDADRAALLRRLGFLNV